jgi:hypothetical protein
MVVQVQPRYHVELLVDVAPHPWWLPGNSKANSGDGVGLKVQLDGVHRGQGEKTTP